VSVVDNNVTGVFGVATAQPTAQINIETRIYIYFNVDNADGVYGLYGVCIL